MKRINRRIPHCFVLAAAILAHTSGKAQEHEALSIPANEAVEILGSGDIPEEEMALRLERLDELASHPIPVNSDRISELSEQNLITEYQLNKLKEYRFRYGPLLCLAELRYIEGWDDRTCERIMPYLEPLEGRPEPPKKKVRRTKSAHSLMFGSGRSFPRSKGYLPEGTAGKDAQPHYAGSPWMLGLRYDICLGKKVCAGLRAGKDPGEEVFPYHPEYPLRMHYPDLLSGYLVIRPGKYISSVCLGDYHLSFGRGITLCTAGGFASWKDPFRQGSAKRILRQNTSMSEWGAFRGAAIEASAGLFSGCVFYSLAKSDPSGYVAQGSGGSFTSFNQSGYHRTQSEIEKRGLVEETAFGGILLLRGNHVKGGLAGCYSRLSMEKRPARMAYDRHGFSGIRNLTLGGFLEAYFRRSSAYVELSLSENRRLAFLAGWKTMLSAALHLTMDIRHFPVAFHPGFHATGAGPYGSLSNQTGILIGLEAGLPGYWTLVLVTDWARTPWISHGSDFPRDRHSLHIRSSKVAKGYGFYIAYTYRQGEENAGEEFTMTPATGMQVRHQADLQFTALHAGNLRYKARISYVAAGQQQSATGSGSAVQQEITSSVREAVKVSLGAILCHTDSYDTRIYLYEPAPLYSSGSIALYGRCVRAYLLFRWSPAQAVDFWVKGGMTVYEDVAKVGGGWDETQGNRRFQVHAQCRVRM